MSVPGDDVMRATILAIAALLFFLGESSLPFFHSCRFKFPFRARGYLILPLN